MTGEDASSLVAPILRIFADPFEVLRRVQFLDEKRPAAGRSRPGRTYDVFLIERYQLNDHGEQ